MSQDITVKVLRGGVQVYAAVYLQLDNMQSQESSYYGGVAPYSRYWGYTLQTLDIRQSDALVDLVNTDPKTGRAVQYRAVTDLENFPDNHGELVLDKVRGT